MFTINSTLIWHKIRFNSGNMFYTVYIIPKRDVMSVYNYMWKHVECGEVGEEIDCALILDGR